MNTAAASAFQLPPSGGQTTQACHYSAVAAQAGAGTVETCTPNPVALLGRDRVQLDINDLWEHFSARTVTERDIYKAVLPLEPSRSLQKPLYARLMTSSDIAYIFEIVWQDCPGQHFVLKLQKPDSEVTAKHVARASRDFKCEVNFYDYIGGRSFRSLVSVIATGETEGLLWVLMEKACTDLFYTVEHLQSDRNAALKAACELTDAVLTLHERGYVHRDLKPENVFVYPDRLKLGDFGVTCLEAECNTGCKVGTLNYWPPECVVLKVEYGVKQQNWTRAGDIWSLGLMLGEMSRSIESQHYLCWFESGRLGCYSTLQGFYDQYRNINKNGLSLPDWVQSVTGHSFDEYLTCKMNLTPFKPGGAPWRVQLLIAALACLRTDPSLRPSAQELHNWITSAQQVLADQALVEASKQTAVTHSLTSTSQPSAGERRRRRWQCCTLQ